MITSASAEAKRGMGCSHGVRREPDTKIPPPYRHTQEIIMNKILNEIISNLKELEAERKVLMDKYFSEMDLNKEGKAEMPSQSQKNTNHS